MKTRTLKDYSASVGVEAYDIDWSNKDEMIALGKLCADQCIVFVDQTISTKQLFDVMTSWGDPSQSLIHRYVLEKKLKGNHWRELLVNLYYVSNTRKDNIEDAELSKAVSIVSYKKDETGRAYGLFQNGKLDWHSDQCSIDDGQRIIGLQSMSDTVNSQTTFACTHDVYEGLSSDMKSMVKELVCKHKWKPNAMAPGLNATQDQLLKYNMVALDGTETMLYRETATGRPGLKLAPSTFDGFVGMDRDESLRIFGELYRKTVSNGNVYTQNWQDGRLVFMDQEITIHARPTNVKDGDLRTMARVVAHLNRLFPDSSAAALADSVRYQGRSYNHDEFAALVDQDRRDTFERIEKGQYLSSYKNIGDAVIG